jgi:EAL domain-containing protein (putative c-di-GMP-specific phosphodiesterase class I)
VFVDNQIQVIETVKRIRQKGIRVSLDDFGTGYSSLSYLRRFPVDTLKIDKSFVDFIGKEEKSDIIISALVGVARSLGLEIVAEGVETTEQSDILKDLKCHVIQGYLYGKPMDGSSAEDLIRRKM